mmetsp:Transcript_8200/g.34441  ORF Transcript_8200/g.34441 Transcript_8200/m.34441 type:complete len:163 (-) Transcript_8200:227-715(-)
MASLHHLRLTTAFLILLQKECQGRSVTALACSKAHAVLQRSSEQFSSRNLSQEYLHCSDVRAQQCSEEWTAGAVLNKGGVVAGVYEDGEDLEVCLCEPSNSNANAVRHCRSAILLTLPHTSRQLASKKSNKAGAVTDARAHGKPTHLSPLLLLHTKEKTLHQ